MLLGQTGRPSLPAGKKETVSELMLLCHRQDVDLHQLGLFYTSIWVKYQYFITGH